MILNSYNQGEFLQEAIDSVLNQTFEDFELIIVDNGSTDNSQELVRNVTDKRVRTLVHDSNRPITQRFNEAIREARAPFVSFLYSDDLYLPTKLGRQVERFRELDSSYGVVTSVAIAKNLLTGSEWRLPPVGSGWVFDTMLAEITRAKSICARQWSGLPVSHCTRSTKRSLAKAKRSSGASA